MRLDARMFAGVVVALGGVWLGVSLFRPEPAPLSTSVFSSSRDCRECHTEVYAEWEGSQHAMSWINPFVRELSENFANTDCIDCHAPESVWKTGIGERVLLRTERRVEGVDCLACHLLPEGDEGLVAGSITDPRAACQPVQKLDLQRAVFCAGCHDQHQTVQQWQASSWADRKDCLDCHMPFRNGDPNQGRDHTCLGGNDLALLQSAVVLEAQREGNVVSVSVANVGAGHSFPTDERSRAADVFWRPLATGGTDGVAAPVPWRHLYRFRSPYRDEVGIDDTLLQADTTWAGAIEDQDAARAIEVALFYKRSPYYADPDHPDPDAEAILVHRVEVAP